MKKITAIFLLFIMLLVNAHPVVAMHFCSGKFHTFKLFQIESDHSCCHLAIEEAVPETGVTCCSIEQNIPDQKQIDETFNSICCENEITQLLTDEFQNQQQHNTASISIPSVILTFLVNFSEIIKLPEINTINLKNFFPPTGRFLTDIDFVSYICVNIN